MKIALFCPNWVGDLVMATPAIRAIRERFIDAEIVAVLRPSVADVLQGLPWVDRQIIHDPRGSFLQHKGWAFAKKLRSEHFDTAVLFPNSLRSAWWAWISGAPQRIGFERNARGWMLTEPIPSPSRKTPHSALEDYLQIVSRLDCDISQRTPELATTPHDELRLDRFWWKQPVVAQRYGGGQRYIALNSGGAFGAAKHWPVEQFAELARRIAWKMERRVLVLCGPSERELARKIVQQADHPAVVSLAEEELSIGLSKAAVRRAELLVTTDSGPRHFAHAFDVPVVTLFGPTHIGWSETHHPHSTHLQLKLDCGPCQQRTCPLGHHRCMKDLTVDQVFRAVQNQMGARPDSQIPIRRAA